MQLPNGLQLLSGLYELETAQLRKFRIRVPLGLTKATEARAGLICLPFRVSSALRSSRASLEWYRLGQQKYSSAFQVTLIWFGLVP